ARRARAGAVRALRRRAQARRAHRHRGAHGARRADSVGARRAGARVQLRPRHAVERQLPEVAQAAHRRPLRAPGQRGFGAAARRARLLEAEARHRRAPLAAEQQARDRARDARADAELRGELDRPRHAGRGFRLARGLIRGYLRLTSSRPSSLPSARPARATTAWPRWSPATQASWARRRRRARTTGRSRSGPSATTTVRRTRRGPARRQPRSAGSWSLRVP